MSKITSIPKNRPITREEILTEETRVYFDELEARVPSYGSGSPEGVVDAPQGATYYDLDGASGSMHYVKTENDIDGDATLGWKLA